MNILFLVWFLGSRRDWGPTRHSNGCQADARHSEDLITPRHFQSGSMCRDQGISNNLMSLVLTPIVYLWVHEIHLLLLVFVIYGFFVQGIFWSTTVWLPELFPTLMRATAPGFIFKTPRLISAIAPFFSGT
jgi:hypothetical protein